MSSILVIGVGNRYRRDDAVGLYAIDQLAMRDLPRVMLREESGEGASLMAAWEEHDHVIIIDAAKVDAPPGSIIRIDAHQQKLPSDFFHYSSHAFGVAEAIEMARVLGQLPPQLIVFAVVGTDFSAGEGLSAEIQTTLPNLAQQIVQEIEKTK
jgi:hydrogenase maturation protease